MKLIPSVVLAFIPLLPVSAHAFSDNMKNIWNNIEILHAKTDDLQNQINHILEGKQGVQGERGIQGARGDKGEQGVPGIPGAQGIQGVQGLPGVYTAGDGITIEGNEIKTTLQAVHIGDAYRGGVVFYVDTSGQHGLIASPCDTGRVGIQWRNGVSGNKRTNAIGNGVGAGELNTQLIIAQQTIDDQNGQFAALKALQYTTSYTQAVHGGWYLPSIDELHLLYTTLHVNGVAAFAPEWYWSSTEASVSTAWMIDFATGERVKQSKSDTLGRVRPISRF